MKKINVEKSEIYKIFTDCWRSCSINQLKSYIDDNVEIIVQWYSKPILGKKECLEYLIDHFEGMKGADFDFSANIDFYENESKEQIPYIIEKEESQMSYYETYFHLEIACNKIKKIVIKY
jgi:hypothetical protein